MRHSELMRSNKIVDILCWKLVDMRNDAVTAGEVDNGGSVTLMVDRFPKTLESAELREDKVGNLFFLPLRPRSL